MYFVENQRVVRYLCTRELEVSFDVEKFLASKKVPYSLDALKLVDSSSLYKTTLEVLQEHGLESRNLLYVMTDNCHVMRGKNSGLVQKMKEVCPRVLDVDGCLCHQGNLAHKDSLKDNVAVEIVEFAERVSNFLDNKPKVLSILKQCEKVLGLNKVGDFCPTRFLSLFCVVDEIVNQFDLIRKIVDISNDSVLKRSFNSCSLVVHLDQFLIHTTPLYHFTKSTQCPTLDLHQCLQLVLNMLSALLFRLGHCVDITTANYVKKIYDSDGEPRHFRSKTEDLSISSRTYVQTAMEKLDDGQLAKIQKQWEKFREEQLRRLVARFQTFLQNQIVQCCFVLHQNSKDFDENSITSLSSLCRALKLPCSDAVDEFARLRINFPNGFTLNDVFEAKQLNEQYPCLHSCVSFTKLILPHNMAVESGFSKMKRTEDRFQSNMDCDTYDSKRLVCDFFDRSCFENYKPPQRLLTLMKNAHSAYKNTQKQKTKSANEIDITALRQKVGVFKRRKTDQISRDISIAEQKLQEAQRRVDKLSAKKRRLEREMKKRAEAADHTSATIIESFFS